MMRTPMLLITLVLGILLLAACEGNVFSLKVGDCYNGAMLSTEESIEVADVDLVSCDDPHKNEVYAVFELPDSTWKSDDYVFKQAEIGCMARFKTFVGIEYELSTLWADIIYPLEKGWKEMDDRRVTCSINQESGMKVSGSAKGSRR